MGAELDGIGVILFGFATFVFDWKDVGDIAGFFKGVMDFDEVCFAYDVVFVGPEVYAT